jgi:anti-sigma-K factor RskA
MRDEHVGDLIELYALGALEPEEQLAVDSHLDECAECRALMEDARHLVELLAWTPDQRMPPPELQHKIRSRIEQLQRLEHNPAVPRHRPGLRSRLVAFLSPPRALAALGLVLLLVLGGWNIVLQRRVATLTAEVSKQQLLETVLHGAGVRVVTMGPQPAAPTAWGSMVINPTTTDGYLVTSGLPSLPKDKIYQLWLLKGEARTNGGTFAVDQRGAGTLLIRAPARLDTYTGCGITVEPYGGSPKPTGARVLRSQSWGSESW